MLSALSQEEEVEDRSVKIHGLDKLVRRWKTAREDHLEIDPVTLSRGLLLERLGASHDKWGRDVDLVLVRVLKKNEHHEKGDEVIWEVPTEDELKKVKTHERILPRNDLLRAWLNSPGNTPSDSS